MVIIKIGVLELQGDFALHHKVFTALGIDSDPVKVPSDLDKVDGLVIPGGESTTISLLMDTFNIREPIIEFGETNPVMGTCAGLILMAKEVYDERVKPLGFLDVTVDRNAYGRQIHSETEKVAYFFNSNNRMELDTTLIRAPKIVEIADSVKVLGKFNDSPVAVISNHHLGLSFHPELDGIHLFHQVLFDHQSEFYYKKLNQIHAA